MLIQQWACPGFTKIDVLERQHTLYRLTHLETLLTFLTGSMCHQSTILKLYFKIIQHIPFQEIRLFIYLQEVQES
jgi:hypothetical protein